MANYGALVHLFNVEIAVEYGLNEAIILENIHYWVMKNEANNTHLHEGRYWTYNSITAFSKLFPYLTTKQIRSTLDKLVKHGLVLKGNFNKLPMDRTTWYALTDKGYLAFGQVIPNLPSGANEDALSKVSICPHGQMDLPPRENGFAHEGKPIPDINTDINTTVNTDKLRPTREDVHRFCISNHLIIDPNRFFDVNDRRGWITKNGQAVNDWKNLALIWDSHEKSKTSSESSSKVGVKREVPSVEEVMNDYMVDREKAERMIQEGLY